MFNGIYQINSVDVVVGNGLVRYGRVVNVTDNGFFADFLCPNGRRRFFPFGSSVFLCEFSRRPITESIGAAGCGKGTDNIAVKILMRDTPSAPWTWFPARMVKINLFTERSLCMAVVRWGEQFARWDIIPSERIRIPSTSAFSYVCAPDLRRKRVEKWTFVQRNVKLPDELCALSSLNELPRLLHSAPWRFDRVLHHRPVAFVEVQDTRLCYLEKRRSSGDFSGLAHPVAKFHHQLIQRLPRVMVTSIPRSETSGSPAGVCAVPVELWLEVFSHLDTIMQTKLRMVCPTWNSILESPLLTTNIIITSFESFENPDRLEYLMASPIFKCLHASTRRIIIADWWWLIRDVTFLRIADMIRYVAEQNAGIRLAAIYMVGFQCRFQINAEYDSLDELDPPDCGQHPNSVNSQPYRRYSNVHFCDFVAGCRALPCTSIQLISCTVELYVVPDYYPSLVINIPAARLLNNNDLEGAVWDALEMCLPGISNNQMQILTEILAFLAEEDARSQEESDLRSVACKVLCATQTSDPRPQSHYRGKKWCVDGLGELQADKLSRVAMHFLVMPAGSNAD